MDVFFYGFQPSPQMGFFVGFDGVNRIESVLRQEGKELAEIESSFSHRQMFVHLFVIVVEVNLTQKTSQGLYPDRERGLAEDVVVARVEAESKMG
jgi:hypothetical protein